MASSTEGKDEAMLQVAAHRRQKTQHDLFRFHPRDLEPVRDSLREPFPTTPGSGMGTLNKLPLELMLNIFQLLDIRSHLRVRRVSRGMRQAASTTKGYREVAEHGLEAIRTILLEKTKFDPTILDVYQLLITPDCSMCPHHGGYLSKLTMKRCCYECATGETTTDIRRVYTSLIPGTERIYEQLRRRFVPGSLIVSGRDLPDQPTGGSVYGMTFVAQSYESENPASRSRDFRAFHRPDMLHYTAIYNAVDFPYYDSDAAEIQHGFNCKGCQAGNGCAASRNVYTKEKLLDHFKTCSRARTMYDESQKKTVGSPAAPDSTSDTAE
ncbi:hypothetical protein EDB80DRAFT_723393 [Ilyonectria destructans]|nr:hypothetical protein EDB80DRAFT_723393 [Ilyonectria destructans]